MAIATVLAAAGLATAVAGTGFGILQSRMASRQGRREMKRASMEQAVFEREAEQRTATDEARLTGERARSRRRAAMRAGLLRGGTIRTSPLGVPGPSMGTRKTLLGE